MEGGRQRESALMRHMRRWVCFGPQGHAGAPLQVQSYALAVAPSVAAQHENPKNAKAVEHQSLILCIAKGGRRVLGGCFVSPVRYVICILFQICMKKAFQCDIARRHWGQGPLTMPVMKWARWRQQPLLGKAKSGTCGMENFVVMNFHQILPWYIRICTKIFLGRFSGREALQGLPQLRRTAGGGARMSHIAVQPFSSNS